MKILCIGNILNIPRKGVFHIRSLPHTHSIGNETGTPTYSVRIKNTSSVGFADTFPYWGRLTESILHLTKLKTSLIRSLGNHTE